MAIRMRLRELLDKRGMAQTSPPGDPAHQQTIFAPIGALSLYATR